MAYTDAQGTKSSIRSNKTYSDLNLNFTKNPATNDGSTPLHAAACNGHLEICELIIKAVDDKNPARYDGVTPLYMAAQNGHYEVCKLIISNVDQKNPACHNGHSTVYSCTKWPL